jgi:osmotically-inducible protein OsmY
VAPPVQRRTGMRTPDRPVPQSYDEIVRRTVPDPDSSTRPTVRQEELAREGFRAMDDDERALRARVVSALEDLVASCNAKCNFDIEVDRATVIVGGEVPDAAMMNRIEERVAGVDGVEHVVNRLVVSA